MKRQENDKTYKKLLVVLCIMTLFFLLISKVVYAQTITESDVQGMDAKEVTGSVFIWLLCALAFLKVSQKMDSFLGSLGLNAGSAGGKSLLTEMMLLTRMRGLGKAVSGGSMKGGQSSSGGGTSFLQGGLAGAVGRSINKNATLSATGQGGNILSEKLFQSSLERGGMYANEIIGNVATGDISQVGAIKGDTAILAMNSYFGGDSSQNIAGKSSVVSGESTVQKSQASDVQLNQNSSIASSLAQSETVGTAGSNTLVNGQVNESSNIPNFTALSEGQNQSEINPIGTFQDSDSGLTEAESIPNLIGSGDIPPIQGSDDGIIVQEIPNQISDSSISVQNGNITSGGDILPSSSPPLIPQQTGQSIPQYTDVEIGGGRIMGKEITEKNPEGIEFAMYHTDQYLKPSGKFDVVESVDGAKWFKQYAQDAVEKTPVEGKDGNIAYDEKIVQKLPPIPRRKDRV